MASLVSTHWLAEELGAGDLIILDASAHLPMAGRDAAGEFAQAHIPGARFLNLKTLIDPDADVMSALPTRAQFDERMGQLGVKPKDRIVLYDDSAMRTSARAWFIGTHYGLDDLCVLDGGLGKWRAEGRAVESGTPNIAPTHFASSGGAAEVRTKADMLANLETGDQQVIDARDAARFTGATPDFRPEVADGHIPGSFNLPFERVLRDDGTFKDAAKLRQVFSDAGIDLERAVVTTCGSGVTASVLLFALHQMGKSDLALYDGSWSDWGSDPTTPKQTGPGAGKDDT